MSERRKVASTKDHTRHRHNPDNSTSANNGVISSSRKQEETEEPNRYLSNRNQTGLTVPSGSSIAGPSATSHKPVIESPSPQKRAINPTRTEYTTGVGKLHSQLQYDIPPKWEPTNKPKPIEDSGRRRKLVTTSATGKTKPNPTSAADATEVLLKGIAQSIDETLKQTFREIKSPALLEANEFSPVLNKWTAVQEALATSGNKPNN